MPLYFWPLAGTLLMQTVTSVMFLTVPVLAPALAADVGFDPSRIGIYTALLFAGAMPVSLVMGSLAGRFGPLRVMQIGILVSCLGLLFSMAGALPVVLTCAVLVGMGYGPNTPGAAHMLARVTSPRERPLVFSIKQSGAPLGGFLAGLLVPWVVVGAGWREALVVSAVIGLLTVLAVQPLRAQADDERRPDRSISVQGSWTQLRMLFADSDLRRLTLASFTYSSVQACLFTFLVTYLVERVGLSLVSAGLAYSCMHIVGVVARISWGWLADRLVPARLVLAGLGAASALSVLLVAWFTPAWPFWAMAAVAGAAGATASGWNGVFLAEIARVAPPDQISAATGGTVFFTYFGLVVGPTVFSAVVAFAGYDGAFYLMAGLVLLAGLSILPRRAKG
ncbi:MAG: MFS transporter [Alphaproteobacteria bacterium]|jgi:sugar phosphate permease|nr:MFS transporter [Alphaproteobacteria bacterium]MDP6567056.1 MFS transporter [Alphaproteobacteria bacterium]MDP6812476.1 MFS transporter [Alphaproteobacteria bacterium]